MECRLGDAAGRLLGEIGDLSPARAPGAAAPAPRGEGRFGQRTRAVDAGKIGVE